MTVAKCNLENCTKKKKRYPIFFFAAQQVVEMVVWKRNLKCCAKFAVTKPAASTMESHRVTDAEDSSNDPSEDWPQCKYSPHHLLTHFFKDNLNISPNFEYHFFLKGTWTTSAKKMVIVW